MYEASMSRREAAVTNYRFKAEAESMALCLERYEGKAYRTSRRKL
jgi:hypothetical protein